MENLIESPPAKFFLYSLMKIYKLLHSRHPYKFFLKGVYNYHNEVIWWEIYGAYGTITQNFFWQHFTIFHMYAMPSFHFDKITQLLANRSWNPEVSINQFYEYQNFNELWVIGPTLKSKNNHNSYKFLLLSFVVLIWLHFVTFRLQERFKNLIFYLKNQIFESTNGYHFSASATQCKYVFIIFFCWTTQRTFKKYFQHYMLLWVPSGETLSKSGIINF